MVSGLGACDRLSRERARAREVCGTMHSWLMSIWNAFALLRVMRGPGADLFALDKEFSLNFRLDMAGALVSVR
jgi:hypothetical protein